MIQEFNNKKSDTEVYGALWVTLTIIMELLLLCSFNQIIGNEFTENKESRDYIMSSSLRRIMPISFLVSLLFFSNPFIAYLVFKNRQAFEVTFTWLLRI